MAEFDEFFNNSQDVDEWLINSTEMGPDTSKDTTTTYDRDQYLMDDYESQLPEENPESVDVPLPKDEVPDTQEPSQLPSQDISTPPQFTRPNFFNPSNITNTPTSSKPNFFNPSTTGPRVPAPRSIFGPTIPQAKEIVKDKDAEDHGEDMCEPTTPYWEPIQSQTPITASIRPSEDTLLPSSNEVTRTPNNAPEKRNASTQQVNMDDDSDDEISIITPEEASMGAQSRWKEPQTFIEIEDDETIIKPEPGNNNEPTFRLPNQFFSKPPPTGAPKMPGMAAIIAKQRAMLKKNKGPAKDPSHGINRHRRPLEHETSPRTSNNKKRRLSGQIVPEDLEQVDAAMRAGSHEDDSWMHEEAQGDDEQERHQLQIKIDTLTRREKNGKISEGEIFELGRLRKQLMLKEKLLRCARGSASRQPVEESLFVPADREEILQRHRLEQKQRATTTDATPDSDSEGEGDDTGDRDSREGSYEAFAAMLQADLDGDGLDGVPSVKAIAKPSKKPRRKVGKTAREVYYRDQEIRREKERAKAQKQNAKGGKGGKGGGRKPAGKGKAAAKKGKGAAKGGKVALSGLPQAASRPYPNQRSGIDEIGQRIINDLMNNDPITERLQNPIFDVGPEPEMRGQHTKSTQLQRLLANIPEGSNTKEAKSDKVKLQQASRSFGYAKVKAVDGKWLIKGMKSTLYHYQLLGAQWMIQRELSDEAPYGGLLADGMGLGKTVQTLACMVGNPPGEPDRNRGVKATLIVVPSSVIEQWLDEIRNHAEVTCFPKVMRYKASSKIPVEVMRDLDIVVCSYQEVMRQFPFPNQKDRDMIANIGYKKWWKKASKSMGELFGVYWYRVVLDEAHAIKNNCARTSLACQNLRSVYRWCLTGTPLLNRLEE